MAGAGADSGASARLRMGCFVLYVSERQSHSSGPNWKWRSQIGLATSWKSQMAPTP